MESPWIVAVINMVLSQIRSIPWAGGGGGGRGTESGARTHITYMSYSLNSLKRGLDYDSDYFYACIHGLRFST